MRRAAFQLLLPVLAILAGALVAAGLSPAAPEKPAQPRFASLAAAETYLRQGPSYRNRILWVYRRRGLPVEVLAQYDVWRRVRMPDGTVGWVHAAMLSARRTVVVTAKANVPLRAGADPGSQYSGLGPARGNCEARNLRGRRLSGARGRRRRLDRQERYLGSGWR